MLKNQLFLPATGSIQPDIHASRVSRLESWVEIKPETRDSRPETLLLGADAHPFRCFANFTDYEAWFAHSLQRGADAVNLFLRNY